MKEAKDLSQGDYVINKYTQDISGGIYHTSRLYQYNPTYLCLKLNGYKDNGETIFEDRAVIHLLITKYILKLGGICSSCTVSNCI